MPGLINGGVGDTESRKSEDDICLTTAYDVEEVLLGNPFDVCIESAGVVDCTGFVYSLVHIANCDEGGELLDGELMFSDELSVNARDIGTRVY